MTTPPRRLPGYEAFYGKGFRNPNQGASNRYLVNRAISAGWVHQARLRGFVSPERGKPPRVSAPWPSPGVRGQKWRGWREPGAARLMNY